MQEVLSEDTRLVRLEHASGENRDRDRLLLKQLPQLLISPPIVFYVANVFHMGSEIGGILAAVALSSRLVIVPVVLPLEQTEFGGVSETLVHPASSAPVVVSITV